MRLEHLLSGALRKRAQTDVDIYNMENEFMKISLLPTLSFTFLRAFYDFHTGGLAQLARALAWHARGQRFESVILHSPPSAEVDI